MTDTPPSSDAKSRIRDIAELVRRLCTAMVTVEMFPADHPQSRDCAMRAYEWLARRNHKGLWRPRSGGQTSDPPSSEPTAQPGAKPAGQPRSANDDATVYVTPSGKKYHRQDCRFVGAGATAMTVREARSRGYTPCARCKPPQ